MEKAKEIVNKILLIHEANRLVGKKDNIDEFAKLIFNYKHNIEDEKRKFNQPEDRNDNPHHHNNRLD